MESEDSFDANDEGYRKLKIEEAERVKTDYPGPTPSAIFDLNFL